MELILNNFRAYNQKSFKFESKIVLFSGPNGSGKTSILEALYFIHKGKSFKNIKNSVLIQENKDYASIIFKINPNLEYSVWLDHDKTKVYKNDEETTFKKIREELSFFVLQSKDYTLIESSSYERKKFFDSLFSFYSKTYKHHLDLYNQQKYILNKFLQNPTKVKDFEKLSKNVNFLESILIKLRKKFVKEINENLQFIFNKFVLPFEFNIDYNLIEETNLQNLKNKTNLHIKNSYDYNFLISNKIVNKFYSESINKISIIILVLAFSEMYKAKRKINFFVLLDDVFSHLDKQKRNQLISLFSTFDTNIFLTDQNKIKESLIDNLELE